MSDDLIRGLPADLAAVLRDHSVIVPQDNMVFDLIAAWANAPTTTASAAIVVEPDMELVSALCTQADIASATTSTACA